MTIDGIVARVKNYMKFIEPDPTECMQHIANAISQEWRSDEEMYHWVLAYALRAYHTLVNDNPEKRKCLVVYNSSRFRKYIANEIGYDNYLIRYINILHICVAFTGDDNYLILM